MELYIKNNLKQYYNIRDYMDTGDLLLWNGRGIVPWFIRKRTSGDVTHASMVITFSEYAPARVFQFGAVGRGVMPTPLSKELEHYQGEVYWLPLKQEYASFKTYLGTEMLSLSGKKYDYKGLFRNWLSRVSLDVSRLYCSELVQSVGYSVGLPKHPDYIDIAMWPSELELLDWWVPPRYLILSSDD